MRLNSKLSFPYNFLSLGLSLTLPLSIIILIFSLSGCGIDPQPKVQIDKGANAIQFSGSEFKYFSAIKGADIQGSDVTVEAWIKASGDGTVYARSPDPRIMLYVETGLARFSAGSTYAATLTDVNDGQWHHIAGVLIGEAHSHAVTGKCDVSDMAGIHMDIYLDGSYQDCERADFPTDVDCYYCSNYVGRDGAGSSMFNGVIDEVRLWHTARTESQIQQCMNQELEWNGECSIDLNILKGYWKFNEGEGASVKDFSGNSPGTKYLCVSNCGPGEDFVQWEEGWVAGYQF